MRSYGTLYQIKYLKTIVVMALSAPTLSAFSVKDISADCARLYGTIKKHPHNRGLL